MTVNKEHEEYLARMRALERKHKIEIAIAIIIYAGIPLYLLYKYLNSGEHDQQVMEWYLLGGVLYYDISRRINKIIDAVEKLNQRNH